MDTDKVKISHNTDWPCEWIACTILLKSVEFYMSNILAYSLVYKKLAKERRECLKRSPNNNDF